MALFDIPYTGSFLNCLYFVMVIWFLSWFSLSIYLVVSLALFTIRFLLLHSLLFQIMIIISFLLYIVLLVQYPSWDDKTLHLNQVKCSGEHKTFIALKAREQGLSKSYKGLYLGHWKLRRRILSAQNLTYAAFRLARHSSHCRFDGDFC